MEGRYVRVSDIPIQRISIQQFMSNIEIRRIVAVFIFITTTTTMIFNNPVPAI